MIDVLRPEVDFALQAVRRAALLVKQVQAELVSPALTKDDLSPVTVADFASQALVGYLLERTFPRDPLVGEEDSSALRISDNGDLEQVTRFVGREIPGAESGAVCTWIDRGGADPQGRFWTIDPIDGTKGFLRGDQYAVALALLVDGQVQVGALGCPNLQDGLYSEPGGAGSLVIAARGQGTWVAALDSPRSFTRLHVSECAEPDKARLLRSFEAGHTNVAKVDGLADALGTRAEPVRMDSQAKYAVLAAGGGELIVRLLSPARPDYREKIWDHAAGSLVLEEAGGKISDLEGKALDFTAGRTLERNRGLLASNGRLHTIALEALQNLGA